ncbi:MAG: type II toxin-antitoxin system ParD family antitoxin [Rickettsiales bacterium]|nr:type II toxin-antitoxin system ParD family antitoxin [Rickettsiales bacterium]
MNLDLSNEIENNIFNKIESGLYKSANEIITKALVLLDRQEAQKLQIDNLINEAEESFSKGNFLTSSQFKSKISQLTNSLNE